MDTHLLVRPTCWRCSGPSPLYKILPAIFSYVLAAHAQAITSCVPDVALRMQSTPVVRHWGHNLGRYQSATPYLGVAVRLGSQRSVSGSE